MIQTPSDTIPQTEAEWHAAYKTIAEGEHTLFLNAAKHCETSQTDGVHMEPEEHKKLAKAVYNMIMEEL